MRLVNSGQRLITAALFVLLLSHCGGSKFSTESTSADTNATGQPSSPAVGGNVSTIALDSGSTSLSVSGLSNDEDVMVFLYSYNESNTSNAYQFGSSENARFAFENLIDDTDSHDEDGDLTAEFHAFLRENENFLDPEAMLSSEASSSKHVIKKVIEGNQKTFKVLNSFSSTSSYDTVTATLRVQTEDIQLYVDNRNASDLTDEDLQTLADLYSEVLPLEKELFGDESDINSDGKFAVLFTQTVNQLGASSGGMVTGFFYAVDLFDSSQYEISNEMEIVYTFVPDTLGTYGSAVSKSFAMENIYPGVIAHEFQHVINFNMHYNVNNASAESGWLNEGLAHLAEDIYSADDQGFMAESGMENPARVSSYLNSVDSICFTCGTSLSQRGGSYLFVRYLYEQAQLGNLDGSYNGRDLLGKLLNTSLRGIDNIVNAALGSDESSTEFKSLLGLFGLAVYLSNTDQTDDDRLGFIGINLRGAQDDNRGTILNGPSIQTASSFPFFDTLIGNSISYIQISGEVIEANGGSLDLQVGDSSAFGGYLIR